MDAPRAGRFEIVVLVASLGGLSALSEVLAGLPAGFPAQVVAVQHGRHHDDTERLARLLQRITQLPVRTAADDTLLRGRGVTVVPAGYHAEVGADRRCTLARTDRLGGGDILLSSLAAHAGLGVIAVVLTGMLRDGTQGAWAVKRAGGRVLVQDPATARAGSMPASAIATGCVDFVLPLHRIAAALVALTMAPGGADLLAVPTAPWARLQA
jgi:two-component system chemotaxis response regulator CheB